MTFENSTVASIILLLSAYNDIGTFEDYILLRTVTITFANSQNDI